MPFSFFMRVCSIIAIQQSCFIPLPSARFAEFGGTGPGAASSGTLNNFINGLFTKAGTDIQGWKATATNQENITTALQTQRDNTSKVDLDTEASNLMTFQKGYQASARFVSVISSLMDGLINNLGR